MQVISQATEKVAKLWGKPKAKDTEYRLMKYHLRRDTEDGVLLHNVMTGQLVLLDADEATVLNALPCRPSEQALQLIEKHFLVPVDYDEHKAMNQLRAMLQAMNVQKDITGYTILPTTHCNARCFYCYESDFERLHMTQETAHRLVEFIEQHHGDKPVSLSWFGGEPLVGVKRIDQICSELTEKGIQYHSSMISNGYLFDEEMVKRAAESWKLKSIQVTLDGTEEVYNKVKAYVSPGESPFKRVLRNIGLLTEAGIVVSIRMNMDQHNADNLEALILQLAERFEGNEKLSANIAILFDGCGFEPVTRTTDQRHALEERRSHLEGLLREHQLFSRSRHWLPSLRCSYCMADNDDCVMVNPDGTFAKCEHYIRESNIGSLNEGVTNKDTLDYWKIPVEWDFCKGCPLLPNCYHLLHCITNQECSQRLKTDKIQAFEASMAHVYDQCLNGKVQNQDDDNHIPNPNC